MRKSLARTCLITTAALGTLTLVAAPASADQRITEGSWYKSYKTCMGRGADLVATFQYYDPSCKKNSLGRYTLKITVKQNGGGGGGGGGGSW